MAKRIASNWEIAVVFWLLVRAASSFIVFSIETAFFAIAGFPDPINEPFGFFSAMIISAIGIWLGVWFVRDFLNKIYLITNKNDVIKKILAFQIVITATSFLWGLSTLVTINVKSLVAVILQLLIGLLIYYFAVNKFVKNNGQIGIENPAIAASNDQRPSAKHLWFGFLVFTIFYTITSFWVLETTATNTWADAMGKALLLVGYFGLSGLFFILAVIACKYFHSKYFLYAIAIILEVGFAIWVAFAVFDAGTKLPMKLAISTKNISFCLGHSRCIVNFAYTFNAKDPDICSKAKISDHMDDKNICYLIIAQNTGDENLCNMLNPNDADGCRKGFENIGKEINLVRGSIYSTKTYLYPDKQTYNEYRTKPIGGLVASGKIILLELPAKVIPESLDNSSNLTYFSSAKVKIMDGQYSGREGWIAYDVITANQ